MGFTMIYQRKNLDGQMFLCLLIHQQHLAKGHSVNLKEEILWKTGDLLPNPIQSPAFRAVTSGPAGQSVEEALEVKTITDVAPDYGFYTGSDVPKTGDVREQGSLVCGMFLEPSNARIFSYRNFTYKNCWSKR